jgi:hypothetical protein
MGSSSAVYKGGGDSLALAKAVDPWCARRRCSRSSCRVMYLLQHRQCTRFCWDMGVRWSDKMNIRATTYKIGQQTNCNDESATRDAPPKKCRNRAQDPPDNLLAPIESTRTAAIFKHGHAHTSFSNEDSSCQHSAPGCKQQGKCEGFKGLIRKEK